MVKGTAINMCTPTGLKADDICKQPGNYLAQINSPHQRAISHLSSKWPAETLLHPAFPIPPQQKPGTEYTPGME